MILDKLKRILSITIIYPISYFLHVKAIIFNQEPDEVVISKEVNR